MSDINIINIIDAREFTDMSKMAVVTTAGLKFHQVYEDVASLRKSVENVIPADKGDQKRWTTARKGVLMYRVGSRTASVALDQPNPLPVTSKDDARARLRARYGD